MQGVALCVRPYLEDAVEIDFVYKTKNEPHAFSWTRQQLKMPLCGQ